MDRSSRLSYAGTAATLPASAATQAQLTRGPPASSRRAPADNETAGPAPVILGVTEDHDSVTEDHDRISRGLNDIVVHRLFGAGIDLHAALGMVDDSRAADKIYHAIGELDQAIRDIRNTVF